MTPLAPNLEEAVAFLELHRPGGPWIVTAITPDGPTTTETFYKPEAVAAWISRQNQTRNIYWMPAEANGTLRKKASKDDIARTRLLWADVDGQLNGHAALPPSTIVASGGGLNLYWILAEWIQNKDEIEACNRWVAKDLGADHCWNVDRILRLPGTINLPNRKKASQGRVPVLARCTEHHPDRVYGLSDLGRVEAPDAKNGKSAEFGDDETRPLTLDDLPAELRAKLPSWAQRLLRDGPQPDEYMGDRSKAVMAVTCALVRAGASDAQIAGILLNPELPIHAHIRDQKAHGPRAYVARQIERACERVEAASGWPEPDMAVVATYRAPPPVLPIEVFGSFWGSWITAAASAKSAPPDFIAAALLPTTGALLVSKRRGSPWAGWSEPAVIWVADIGPPSSGKSPAIDAVADLMRRLEVELNEDFPDRRRQWKTDKLEAETRRALWEAEAKDAVKRRHKPPLMPFDCEEPGPPNERRLIVNDVTPEKLVRLAAVNPFGLVHQRDELAGWLGGMDRYGGAGSERALWLEAFGARPFVIDRVKEAKPIRADALAVGILGGIQPDRLATLVLAGDDDGLAARILYVWPDVGPPRRPERAADDAAAMVPLRRIASLDTTTDGPLVLPLTSAAADELQQWRVDVAAMEGSAAGLFLSWLGKLPGLAVRLALVLEHLWWAGDQPQAMPPTTVGENATLAAIGFLEGYALPMAKRAFGDASWPQAERDAAALGKYLQALRPLPETINARALRHQGALHTRDAERYDAALEELEAAGWVRPAPTRVGGKAGRQSKDWAVNPAVGAGHE